MNLKNSGDSTGFEPMTSAMPVQCSNQLNYEVTQLRVGQFVGLMFSGERNVVQSFHGKTSAQPFDNHWKRTTFFVLPIVPDLQIINHFALQKGNRTYEGYNRLTEIQPFNRIQPFNSSYCHRMNFTPFIWFLESIETLFYMLT